MDNTRNRKRYLAIVRLDKINKIIRRYELLLECNLHPNKHLQNSFNRYGNVFNYTHSFKYYSYDNAKHALDEFITAFNTNNSNYGYNYVGDDSING